VMKRPILHGVSVQQARNTNANICISVFGAVFTECRAMPEHVAGG
jgi:hypothetical protein